MKKRFIPATVAALALSFSSIAVPQAVAQTSVTDENEPGGENGDENGGENGDGVAPAFEGTALNVIANGEKQDTGLNLTGYNADETRVTATDADGDVVPVRVDTDGDIFLTPATDVTGPITITVTDPDLVVPLTETVAVATPEEDGSSLSSDLSSDNLGLILGGGVLVALIGVIAAIGGGFIQLPPAIANLIPFL